MLLLNVHAHCTDTKSGRPLEPQNGLDGDDFEDLWPPLEFGDAIGSRDEEQTLPSIPTESSLVLNCVLGAALVGHCALFCLCPHEFGGHFYFLLVALLCQAAFDNKRSLSSISNAFVNGTKRVADTQVVAPLFCASRSSPLDGLNPIRRNAYAAKTRSRTARAAAPPSSRARPGTPYPSDAEGPDSEEELDEPEDDPSSGSHQNESSDSSSQDSRRGSQTAAGPRTPSSAQELFEVASDTDEEYVELFDYTPKLGDLPLEEPPTSTREKRKTSRSVEYDTRTAPLDVRPGDEVEWSLDVEVAQRIPAAFKHKLKDRAADRLVSRKKRSAASAQRAPAIRFLLDSGCNDLQVPESMRHLVDDLGTVPPIYLNTAGQGTTVLREGGVMRFKVQGVDRIFEMPCYINPDTDLCLFPAIAWEKSPEHYPNIKVQTYADRVMVYSTKVPVFYEGLSAFLELTILSGPGSASRDAFPAKPVDESYGFVHRVCGHAHEACCRRTADKAKGLPSLKRVSAPKRPCPECAFAKMRHVPSGQGHLGTGLVPKRPGEVLCGDVFGPVQIAGLGGERYFVTLVCQFSNWGVVRAFTSLEEIPDLVEEMVNEARAALNVSPQEVSITLHTDNASVFASKKQKSRLAQQKVKFHFASAYDPRTNPYAERHGGILIGATRALLLEGSYPPKFWSLLVRVAQWILNRLVREDGFAPIEVFSGAEVDFSNVHPTGTLCYWALHKKQRDDPKLGSAAAVGVYIGPGEAFNTRGHMVFTANNRLSSVSHVLVDDSSKPFQLGLLRELLKRSSLVTGVYDHAMVDPGAFILPTGESAWNYLGLRVMKQFADGNFYGGQIINLIPPEADESASAIYFRVAYDDGDTEDLEWDEIAPILEQQPAAAAAASRGPERDLEDSCHPPEDRRLSAASLQLGSDRPAAEVPEVLGRYSELIFTASRHAAASAKGKGPALPFGESYSWMKVFKMKPEDRKRHFAAMQAEIDKLTSAGHARWEHLPPGEIAIPGVGVFRVKTHDMHNAEGTVLKARFCADGTAVQEPSGGWDRTANVASYSQLLTVIAIATHYGFGLAQIDVKSAFTQVALKDDQRIWIKPLPGLGDPEGKGRVLRLVHHLYGHPLANAAWQARWVELMQEFGFTVVDSNGTVFSYKKGKEKLLVATVVDDSIIAYSSPSIFKEFRDFIEGKLPIAVSELQHVAGMRVTRNDDGSVSVDQQEYIEKKAAHFGCNGCVGKWPKTPMCDKFRLGDRPEVVDQKRVALAREIVGSLIYATLTRPDIKYPCSKLASVVTNPTEDDIEAMKRVLRYLYFSRKTKLVFKPGTWKGPDGQEHDPLRLVVYVDAGFAQEANRKSQTGFTLMLAGAAIFAKSGKQTQVTDSTPYAETVALHEAANWALVMRRYLSQMFATQKSPVPIYEDNQAAVRFATKGSGPRSLHWDVKLEYVHELHQGKYISVEKIGTGHQIADVLTKPLPADTHLLLSEFLLGGPVIFSK